VIFVILIIGILAALAIPKFLYLKDYAFVTNIINQTLNGSKKALEAAANFTYLENNTSFKLKDLISINAKGWKYNASYMDGDYYYPTADNTKSITYIVLNKSKKEIVFRIQCQLFPTPKQQEICKRYIQSDLSFTTYYAQKHLKY
jgi:type II secretory pathway pseudopilin PulG